METDFQRSTKFGRSVRILSELELEGNYGSQIDPDHGHNEGNDDTWMGQIRGHVLVACP